MKRRLIILLMGSNSFFPDISLLVFRCLLALELLLVHGVKKLYETVDQVPNPFPALLTNTWNYYLVLFINIVCPFLIIIGLFTRAAALAISSVTLTGYLVVHFNDSLAVRDIPFMYSLCALILYLLGPGGISWDMRIYKRLQHG